jgi:hypothetical protein
MNSGLTTESIFCSGVWIYRYLVVCNLTVLAVTGLLRSRLDAYLQLILIIR